ncbi:TrmH family RNA methyltransferase [Robiginitomaculum antarcticum]|uniref:TrmH family RNA methyltransferase n=1 Tax=Robiginitomaculum antarcticum TaxID=437507 RepID=UPI00037945D0|nr:RNA methyltransferase [Robiginitomaculum antarcticum]
MSRPPRNSRKPKNSAKNRAPTAKTAAPQDSRARPAQNRQQSLSKGLIWGQHAVIAALANPRRQIHKGWVSPAARARLNLDKEARLIETDPAQIDNLVPKGAVHQGLALHCAPLAPADIDAIMAPAEGLILVLDQLTDPHNVGAMFRLAAAFGARGIIMQDRKAPPLDGAVAKVAVGYVETVPCATVTNIANTLLSLREDGWMVTGLAGETDLTLQQALRLPKNATVAANVIVLGAEGPGLRKRVRDCCDQVARIPMPGGAESLNVSTAAAIAVYEAVRGQS